MAIAREAATAARVAAPTIARVEATATGALAVPLAANAPPNAVVVSDAASVIVAHQASDAVSVIVEPSDRQGVGATVPSPMIGAVRGRVSVPIAVAEAADP